MNEHGPVECCDHFLNVQKKHINTPQFDALPLTNMTCSNMQQARCGPFLCRRLTCFLRRSVLSQSAV